ncbi:MAG TPA: YsnF/AvaK domain-containing protein [Ktedonobacteraceae bacterium]|nr:YsnF/AvaK domain-containing protein [Ktedonobacteraceae bacterium]
MTTTGNPIVAAIFQTEDQARQAMNDLQQAGFSNDQIRYSVHRGGTGITDSLMNLGLSQQDANFYNSQFEAGKTIVTVNTNDRQQEACNILTQDGGQSANANYGTTMGTTAQTASNRVANNVDQAAKNVAQTASATTGQGANAVTGNQTESVQLREEQLQVNKQPVQTGEVGLRKEVVTEQQTINVPVNREEVVIEKRPVSGQPTDQPIGEGETIRVPVSEEQVNVTKQTVPTGEVAIGKRQVQDTQQVSDTVRREEAHLVQEGDVDVEGDNIQDVTDRQP